MKLNSDANPLQPVGAPTSIGVTTFPENPMKLKKIESMGGGDRGKRKQGADQISLSLHENEDDHTC